MSVAVDGLAQLNRLFALADRESKAAVRAELREVGEPVARTAELNAILRIRRTPHSPEWTRMRTGVTRNLVYVVPKKRGVKAGDPAARPKFSRLMMDRAMKPALDRHAPDTERRMNHALDRIADRFNRA